jgi:hypothetical protein
MLRRFSDWPELLAKFLLERTGMPFEWGRNDCALFSCDAIQEITGTDIAADLRGYSSEEEAQALIARFGSLEALARSVTAAHQMPEVPILRAQRGDVALFDSRLGPTLGIISLDGSIAAPGPRALEHSPISQAIAAWRVG